MVKNYTRPGFQFVPGNGRSTFLLSRAQSEPIVRDEYFKTNTRNFYPMFAQFSALRAPNVSMFHLTSVEALVVSLILSTPLPSAQRRISYFFVQIGGLTHQSRALIYRGATGSATVAVRIFYTRIELFHRYNHHCDCTT